MKPPHFLCKNCGIIIIDQGHEPDRCIYCGGSGFYDLGYEGSYNPKTIRKELNVPSQKEFWKQPRLL
jgi:hypothetical protein